MREKGATEKKNTKNQELQREKNLGEEGQVNGENEGGAGLHHCRIGKETNKR